MEKKENRGFHFQEAFMQPFERIMQKSRISSNRELILYVRTNNQSDVCAAKFLECLLSMLATNWLAAECYPNDRAPANLQLVLCLFQGGWQHC